MTSETRVLPSKAEVAKAGADLFVSAARDAVEARGSFNVALAGGSTPMGMYQLLAEEPYRSQVEWSKVSFYWGDERCVPPDHSDSNYGAAAQAIIEPLGIPEKNVHRMRGEIDPERAAEEYSLEVQQGVPGQPPGFDLILLGMGDDGHTASLFPSTHALEVSDRIVTANYVPKLDSHRLTFTARLINAARLVVFLVTGEGKAEALQAVLEGERDPHTYPSQLVAPESGRLVWLTDEPAARLLTPARSKV